MSHPERRPDPEDRDSTPKQRGNRGRAVVGLTLLGVIAGIIIVMLTIWAIAF
ncbi:hypothetical protein ACI8AC_19325 [Geodermatophilus sp. SYSU D00758]